MSTVLNSHKGFTLIELMISLAAASIVTAGIYGFYHVQQKSHVTQQVVVEMQQNVRATLSLMKREIRMMGYDPAAMDGEESDGDADIDEADESSDAGIVIAARDMIQFDWDSNGNCTIDNTGTGEEIIYRLPAANDTNGDGIADSGSAPLGRDLGGPTPQLVTMADNVQAVGFAYAYDDDGDEQLDTSAGGNVIWAYDSDADGFLDRILDTNDDGLINAADTVGGDVLAPTINIGSIRSVRIWLLGRTSVPIRDHQDNGTYVIGDRRVNAAGDSFQRRLLVETIHCRNMAF